jgi:hypothetical protein
VDPTIPAIIHAAVVNVDLFDEEVLWDEAEVADEKLFLVEFEVVVATVIETVVVVKKEKVVVLTTLLAKLLPVFTTLLTVVVASHRRTGDGDEH